MANLPDSVVIVGGSLAGLFHGLYLKRHGVNVVILEQDPSPIRSSHNAGITFGPSVEEILRKYDDTGIQNCIPSVASRLVFGKRQACVKEVNVTRHLTSWGLLYRILRANFDGLVSEAIPNPPLPRKGDGKAEYRSGKRVTNLQYEGHVVTVVFVDGDGNEESITADLVIGADGLHSTVRALVQAPTVKEYSGYVAWRGTVPEKHLPEDTVNYFSNRTSLQFLKNTYFVVYAIPPDNGTFTPGSRLLNWVWYCNTPSPASSATRSRQNDTLPLADLLTDKTSHTHTNTVPAGLINPAVWQHHLASTLPSLPHQYTTLLTSTPVSSVFVTKVNDALTSKTTFHDGKVILVGDALATFRPHVAVATEHAARHCLGLGKVWKGEMTLEQWEGEMGRLAKGTWLASRAFGCFGCGRWWEFLGAVWGYVVFLVAGWVRKMMGRG